MTDVAAALLELLAREDGLSVARVCKRLGLSRSELQRLLAQLGDTPQLGGLGLVRVAIEDGRETVWLSDRARSAYNTMPSALVEHAAMRLDGPTATPVHETLAEETPVALLFNGVPHVVMMATPSDLEDFALGFALTEGIVERADELRVIECLPRERGLALHLAIPQARFDALDARRRNLVGRSGCGLCGAEALDAAIRPIPRVAPRASVDPARLSRALVELEARQPMNRECGALHAAAALIGDELLVREDVGRHNALDKVVGALAHDAAEADALLVTSRASYELVHKSASVGIATLVAVSAPTAHAVRLAREAGMHLYGFAREDRLTRYAP